MPLPSFKDFAKKQYYKQAGWGKPSKFPTKPIFTFIFRDLDSNRNIENKDGESVEVNAFSGRQALWYFFRDHPTFRGKNIDAIKVEPPKILSVPPPRPKPITPPKTVESELGLEFKPEPRRYNDH